MIYILAAAFLFIGDFIIKNWIEKHRELGKPELICNNRLIIERYHNTGAMLNFMGRYQKFVAVLSGMVGLIIGGAFLKLLNRRGFFGLKLSLACILGGGLSNVYDRFHRKYVVDYLRFNVKGKKLRNIVFNLSDFAVFLGAILLLLCKKPD